MDYISSKNIEYRILDWIGDIDNESEIKKCITHVYNNSDFDQKENFDLISINMHDAWISDQVEGEYQVVHRHSGYSEIGFACVLYLLMGENELINLETHSFSVLYPLIGLNFSISDCWLFCMQLTRS